MEILLSPQTWIIVAVVLGAAELFVPGGILFNLGLASLIVSLGLHFNILDTWMLTLTVWFISASILLFAFSFVSNRFFKGDESIDNVYEELDIFGKDVVVVEKIGPGNNAGRVSFQGSTWSALGDGSELNIGEHAKVVCTDNISLIVEPQK